jgi:hypothetical protein
VDANDWSTAVEKLIIIREAECIVHGVMSVKFTAGFPIYPEDSFNEHDLHSTFRKTAPWGRLVSVLLAHKARLRALPSVALVWCVFSQELGRRWNANESLPNMHYIQGWIRILLKFKRSARLPPLVTKRNFSVFSIA